MFLFLNNIFLNSLQINFQRSLKRSNCWFDWNLLITLDFTIKFQRSLERNNCWFDWNLLIWVEFKKKIKDRSKETICDSIGFNKLQCNLLFSKVLGPFVAKAPFVADHFRRGTFHRGTFRRGPLSSRDFSSLPFFVAEFFRRWVFSSRNLFVAAYL